MDKYLRARAAARLAAQTPTTPKGVKKLPPVDLRKQTDNAPPLEKQATTAAQPTTAPPATAPPLKAPPPKTLSPPPPQTPQPTRPTPRPPAPKPVGPVYFKKPPPACFQATNTTAARPRFQSTSKFGGKTPPPPPAPTSGKIPPPPPPADTGPPQPPTPTPLPKDPPRPPPPPPWRATSATTKAATPFGINSVPPFETTPQDRNRLMFPRLLQKINNLGSINVYSIGSECLDVIPTVTVQQAARIYGYNPSEADVSAVVPLFFPYAR